MAVLRNFRGGSSLATYLTVIARRVVVHDLVKQKQPARLGAEPMRPCRGWRRRHRAAGLGRRPGAKWANKRSATAKRSNGCSKNWTAPRPKSFACTTWKAKPITKSARPSACPKTASGRH